MPRRPLNSNPRSDSPRTADRPRLAGAVLLAGVRGYQLLLRPLLPQSCRFHPSCSEYAREAVTRHGALRGSGLALRRLGRCHPWHPGGWDPVPSGKT